MLIVIIDNNELIKEKVSSNYVYKKIIINKQEIKLVDDYSFSDGSKIKKLSYTSYEVIHEDNKILLFIYKDGKEKFRLYENKGLSFGKDEKNEIISLDPFIKDGYIILKGNTIQTNSKYLYVNNKLFDNKELKDGDVVELFSFKFIYNHEFLYINNYLNEIKLNKYNIKEKEFNMKLLNHTIITIT